jgi:hypothetical protein
MGKYESSRPNDDWRFAAHLAHDYHDADQIREHRKESRRYNGWTNYETWSVNLILSNEQSIDAQAREIVEIAMRTESDKELRRSRAADALKEWVLTEVYTLQEYRKSDGGTGDIQMLIDQLTMASLSEVDWFEVADAFAPEEVLR